jgi:Zn ribbon nucleic-acid-binding protein
LKKGRENVDINNFFLHDLERKNYKKEYIKLIDFDEYEFENCINCGCFLTKIDEKIIQKEHEIEQIIEIYECKKCGYLYEFSLKKVQKTTRG